MEINILYFFIFRMSKLLSCVLASYPDLDSDIANYIGAMLDEQAEVELLKFWK